MNSVKILFILLHPIPFPGAAWSRVGFFAKFLSNDGFFDVKICGAFTPKSFRKAGSSGWNGINLINCFPAISLLDPLSFTINYVSSLIVSFFIFMYMRLAYVFISVPSIGNSMGCYNCARILGLKVVTDYRDEWEDFLINRSKSKLSRRIYEWQKNSMTQNYNKNFLLITTTRSLASGLKARGIRNIHTVPNGADTKIFKPSQDVQALRKKFGFSSEDLLIVYSGYIGGYYRIDIIIKSLYEVIKYYSNLKLLIIGRGSGINDVFRQSTDPLIKDHVIYLGVKDTSDQVAEILSMCDIGIVPYDSNPLWRRSIPVKSLEYIACGLPIFATVFSDSDLAALIRDNQLGTLADPENIHEPVNGLINLISCKDYRSKAGTTGVKLAQSTFDRSLIAQKLRQVIMIDVASSQK